VPISECATAVWINPKTGSRIAGADPRHVPRMRLFKELSGQRSIRRHSVGCEGGLAVYCSTG